MFVKVITTKEGSVPAEAVLLKESLRLYRYRYRMLNSIYKVSASCGIKAWSVKLVYNGLDGNKYTVFFRLSAHDQLSAHPSFFTVRGGTASATVRKNLAKPSPRRSKKSEITYLSSCRVCKPALNSWFVQFLHALAVHIRLKIVILINQRSCIPFTEKFPRLYPHCAVNRKYTVISLFNFSSIDSSCRISGFEFPGSIFQCYTI